MPVQPGEQTWGVIFDCDGVVVNSEPLGLAALESVVRKYGLPLQRLALDHYCGQSDKATHADFVARYGEFCALDTFIDDINQAYVMSVKSQGLNAFPGLQPLLASLRAAGVPYGLGSSSQRQKLAASLQAADLRALFPVVVGGDDVAQAKPAPDIFLMVAERLQIAPGRCVVIEDSPTGIQAARNAGMVCVAVTTSFDRTQLADAQLIVDGLEQLDVCILRNLVEVRQENDKESPTGACPRHERRNPS